jgi:hypothetical protein
MKLSLQSYFDLGASFGLDDDVFRASSTTAAPDIAGIGLRNPLGLGIVCNLKATETGQAIMTSWKEKAKDKVNVPEMELGYVREPNLSGEEDKQAFMQFKEELIKRIEQHPIDTCELTIYAIGTVFVRLDLAGGIPPQFLQGFYKCYEYAAYSVEVSHSLREMALQVAEREAGGRGERLRKLSQRPEPEIHSDDRGYQESKLFTGFTCVGLCVDESDDVEAIQERLREIEGGDFQSVTFAYHGKLHFGWAACVLEPRTRGLGPRLALDEMARMLLCIQIAHVFLGTCEAFERLFLHETVHQVDKYVQSNVKRRDSTDAQGRNSRDLNRLRTLALAVVSLTNYGRITATDEDQMYFKYWERHANIERRHGLIQDQCELLYNVQVAETQGEEASREKLLSRVVLFLTAFTFVSVMTDSYSFVRDEEKWLILWSYRLGIMTALFAGIAVVLGILLRYLQRLSRDN